MRKRLVGLLAGAVLVFAACGTAATPSPSASTAASTPPVSAPASAPASASAAAIDLTNTTYKPEAGQDGGSIIIGDWQEANPSTRTTSAR
jgi:ABC-type glycerol-3-phosphate transport system substrate-binding protein